MIYDKMNYNRFCQGYYIEFKRGKVGHNFQTF